MLSATMPVGGPAAAPRLAIAIADESQAAEWDRYVTHHPRANGYHVWRWRRVFVDCFGHDPVYLTARRADRVVGVLPLVHIRSWVFGPTLTSLPFLNYGGIVADDSETADGLVDAAARIAVERKCPHIELRHVARCMPSLPARQHKVTMLLPLQEGMWDRLDRKVRNQVRKAQKSELVAERGGRELLDDFYGVFARNMRDLGTPVYPRRFFAAILETFPERTAVHVVRLGHRTVAASLTYRTGDTVEVPWASSVRDYNPLCPNHLLYWHMIETSTQAGARTFDFGRSTPGEGTFKFKAQWGAEPVALHWEYRLLRGHAVPNVSPSNPRYRLMIKAWQRLPLAMASRLGPLIVGSIP